MPPLAGLPRRRDDEGGEERDTAAPALPCCCCCRRFASGTARLAGSRCSGLGGTWRKLKGRSRRPTSSCCSSWSAYIQLTAPAAEERRRAASARASASIAPIHSPHSRRDCTSSWRSLIARQRWSFPSVRRSGAGAREDAAPPLPRVERAGEPSVRAALDGEPSVLAALDGEPNPLRVPVVAGDDDGEDGDGCATVYFMRTERVGDMRRALGRGGETRRPSRVRGMRAPSRCLLGRASRWTLDVWTCLKGTAQLNMQAAQDSRILLGCMGVESIEGSGAHQYSCTS
eukprot:SAG25_NODE_853_length_5069_cov_10.802012_1_plen_286_part_00